MIDEPLNSKEQIKVFMFILLMIPTIPALLGILPTIFLVFGVFLLKKNGDFSGIENSTKIVIVYLWILILIAAFLAGLGVLELTQSSTYQFPGDVTNNKRVFGPLIFAFFFFVYIIFVKALYLSPLTSHKDWVVRNGILSRVARKDKNDMKRNADIFTDQKKMQSYSVADELSKWSKLRDEGVVSEQEFQDARNKILKSH